MGQGGGRRVFEWSCQLAASPCLRRSAVVLHLPHGSWQALVTRRIGHDVRCGPLYHPACLSAAACLEAIHTFSLRCQCQPVVAHPIPTHRTALLSSVDPVPSLAGKVLSGGRLNVRKAIAVLLGAPQPTLPAQQREWVWGGGGLADAADDLRTHRCSLLHRCGTAPAAVHLLRTSAAPLLPADSWTEEAAPTTPCFIPAACLAYLRCLSAAPLLPADSWTEEAGFKYVFTYSGYATRVASNSSTCFDE